MEEISAETPAETARTAVRSRWFLVCATSFKKASWRLLELLADISADVGEDDYSHAFSTGGQFEYL